jgi:hypothetical protein
VLGDVRKHITTSHGSANTLTIPLNATVAFPTETLLTGTNIGAGTMTLTPESGSVTLNAPSLIVPQNGWWWAKKTNTNTWQVVVVTGSAASSGGTGGGMGFRFTYSATTTDADPGAGTLRLSSASYATAGSFSLYVDLAEYGGTDVTAWLDSLDDYSGSIKGIVRLSSQSDPTKWVEYTMTAWTTASGYRKLTVVYKDGPGGLTTTAGDTFFAFDYATSGQLLANGTIPLSATWALGNFSLTGARCITYNGEIDNGNSSTADTVDWTAGQAQKSTLTGNCTFTFTAPPGVCQLSLKLIQDGTGSRTVTWPGAVTWVGGTAPTLSTTAAAVDLVSFYYDGSVYYGSSGSASLPAGTTGDALCYSGTAWVSTSTFLSNKIVSHSSADANAAVMTLRKSRGTSGSPTAHNADDVLAEWIAQGHDGSAYFNAGRIRFVAKAAGGTKKTTWRQVYHHDGNSERVVEESCVEYVTTTDNTDSNVFTIAIANDEQVSVLYRIRGVGPSNKHIWREHYVTYRRVGAGAPGAALAETYLIPLNNTDDTDWSISHSISSNDLLITVNGEAATTINWKCRVTIERD